MEQLPNGSPSGGDGFEVNIEERAWGLDGVSWFFPQDLEALHEGWRKKRFTMDELWRFAELDRVTKVIMPYL